MESHNAKICNQQVITKNLLLKQQLYFVAITFVNREEFPVSSRMK